jgi:hypothetical protein
MQWYFYLIFIWLTVCVLSGLIAALTAKGFWARLIIVVMMTAAVLLTFGAPYSLLGRAKPAEWAWLERGVDEADILGADMIEGVGIYLLLKFDEEPQLYVFPWNQEFAQNVQQAMQQAAEAGTNAVIERPFDNASPGAPLEDLINDLLGEGQGQGQGEGEGGQGVNDGQGEGNGQGDGQGEGEGQGNGEGEGGHNGGGNQGRGLDDRPPPMVYPRPQPPTPPKPPESGGGVIYDR